MRPIAVPKLQKGHDFRVYSKRLEVTVEQANGRLQQSREWYLDTMKAFARPAGEGTE